MRRRSSATAILRLSRLGRRRLRRRSTMPGHASMIVNAIMPTTALPSAWVAIAVQGDGKRPQPEHHVQPHEHRRVHRCRRHEHHQPRQRRGHDELLPDRPGEKPDDRLRQPADADDAARQRDPESARPRCRPASRSPARSSARRRPRRPAPDRSPPCRPPGTAPASSAAPAPARSRSGPRRPSPRPHRRRRWQPPLPSAAIRSTAASTPRARPRATRSPRPDA